MAVIGALGSPALMRSTVVCQLLQFVVVTNNTVIGAPHISVLGVKKRESNSTPPVSASGFVKYELSSFFIAIITSLLNYHRGLKYHLNIVLYAIEFVDILIDYKIPSTNQCS